MEPDARGGRETAAVDQLDALNMPVPKNIPMTHEECLIYDTDTHTHIYIVI